ncbi:MAG: SAM-dependent methyltransferase [Methylobacterium sp. SCN 67-24]|nr:MAG: SAM-dependent methyltransferase [Methylobacterium sp. SCN 67-24]
MPEAEIRQFAPSAQRNRDPILAVLRETLPAKGLVLEIASGSGEHAMHFAAALPGLSFQPSDPNAEARASIDAWAKEAALPNLLPALALDASTPGWPLARADAVICINMIHISPWAATQGLIAEAARLLPPGGPLYLYGPYRQSGVPLAPSNAAFDESLRGRDPRWGLRELDTVAALAAAAGFGPPEVTAMPANNLSVVFRKR